MSTKEKLIRHKKRNVRLFPLYKMVSWDLLFYYPIIFLFLTQVKGFSAAQVLFSDAFYTLSNTLWQIPVTRLVDRVGKKNALIVGNILYTLSILSMIFMQEYYQLLIIQFIYALGYSIKGICEANILYDSLPKGYRRGKIFSKIDGKSTSYFYIFEAIASTTAGFTFVINGYIPMILCFICCTIATILSFKFRHTTIVQNNVKPIKFTEYMVQLKTSFRYFLKSKRIRSLIMFNALLMGTITAIVNLRSSILKEIHVPEQYFGIIFAMLQIIAAISTRNTEKIQDNFRNKTLTWLGVPMVMSCIVIGFIGQDQLSRSSLILIIVLFAIQYAIKGPYVGLMTRYLNNFTNRSIRPKISALRYLTANLATAILSLISSGLLAITTTANTFITIGCITTIGVVLLLDYMTDKVGLKPEEYSDEDIRYSINRPEKIEKELKVDE